MDAQPRSSHPSWQALSISSKTAFRCAWAVARHRAEASTSRGSNLEIDSFDLFVGQLLAHPQHSELLDLLQHVGIPPGQLLPPDRPRPRIEDLQPFLDQVADDLPPISKELELLLEEALRIGSGTRDPKFTELGALSLASLTASKTELARRFEGELRAAGAEPRELVNAFEKHLMSGDSRRFADVLSEQLPFTPRPISIPNYSPDGTHAAGLDDDLLGIGAEVDAFAYLMCSRELAPPLAIGLFGDWGSGKSYFMRSVRRRIEQLTSDPRVQGAAQREVPFWKRIVQIEFNAWNYVGGDLWASLVTHVFDQLVVSGESRNEGAARVAERRAYWLAALEDKRNALAKQAKKHLELTRELEAQTRRVDDLRAEHARQLAAAEQAGRTESWELFFDQEIADASAPALKNAKEVAEELGLGASVDDLGSLRDTLREAREALSGFRGVGAALQSRSSWKWLLWLLVPVALSVVLEFFSSEDLLRWAVTGLSAVGALAAQANRVGAWLGERNRKLSAARTEVDAQLAELRRAQQARLVAARENVAKTANALESLEQERAATQEQRAAIEEQLAVTGPGRLLHEFVAERQGSEDYRAHLGVQALVREDFRTLSDLIDESNAAAVGDRAVEDAEDPHAFHRIVLYIDDLDRCPDERVVEVLQAVHLLLAFRLFVVVVAVDARWLSHALREHYPALAAGGSAQPEDYLEKVFQVPFWVQSVDEAGRRRMIRGLVPSTSGGDGTGSGDVAVTPNRIRLHEDHVRALASLGPSAAPGHLEIAALRTTTEEAEALESMGSLLGGTPRGIKRFVNLYQLLRIVLRRRLGPDDVRPSQPLRAALLLALSERTPRHDCAFLQSLQAAKPTTKFGTLVRKLGTKDPLRLWLEQHGGEDWDKLPVKHLQAMLPHVQQFRFALPGKRADRAAANTSGAGTSIGTDPSPHPASTGDG